MAKKEKQTAETATIKRKTDDIVALYRIISSKDTKISKLTDNEKFKYVRELMTVKKVGTAFDELVKEAQEKLKPEGFDNIISKLQKEETLTTGEQEAVNKYDKDVNDCVKEELEKEVDLGIAPWNDGLLGRFISSNDWNVATSMTVIETLGA